MDDEFPVPTTEWRRRRSGKDLKQTSQRLTISEIIRNVSEILRNSGALAGDVPLKLKKKKRTGAEGGRTGEEGIDWASPRIMCSNMEDAVRGHEAPSLHTCFCIITEVS